LPSPQAMGAPRFPEGASVGGLDATYARLTSKERDGTRCFHLIRLSVGGEAQLSQGCAVERVEALVSDDRVWSDREHLGDYAHRDGRIWLRIVHWDPLAEEHILGAYELVSCGGELRSTQEPSRFSVVHPYTLLSGTAAPDASTCR
jgi:hypothetical protein